MIPSENFESKFQALEPLFMNLRQLKTLWKKQEKKLVAKKACSILAWCFSRDEWVFRICAVAAPFLNSGINKWRLWGRAVILCLFKNSTISNLSRNHFLIVGSDFLARAGIYKFIPEKQIWKQRRKKSRLMDYYLWNFRRRKVYENRKLKIFEMPRRRRVLNLNE